MNSSGLTPFQAGAGPLDYDVLKLNVCVPETGCNVTLWDIYELALYVH